MGNTNTNIYFQTLLQTLAILKSVLAILSIAIQYCNINNTVNQSIARLVKYPTKQPVSHLLVYGQL